MKNILLRICISSFLILSCTFDYGGQNDDEDALPDLIMKNVEYVRVRSSDPIARIQAERVERYDGLGIMKLDNFSFEQYGERGEETNAFGMAGHALVDLSTVDIFMEGGVRIEVESEDIIIETNQLEWRDEPRILTSGEGDEVNIFQDNGTDFVGIDLRVDARRRTWEFSGAVSGTYVHEDDDTDDAEPQLSEND